jgi:hypothetical protein
VPNAGWTQINPFESYRTVTHKRDPSAGAHAEFLRLKKLCYEDDHIYLKAADVLASRYGLLGLFYLTHSAPILPKGKLYVSPEAVVQKNGHLRLVDPTTDGLRLVAKAVNDSRPATWQRLTKEHYGVVAMPAELSFAPKNVFRRSDDPSGYALSDEESLSWNEVRTQYDALFVLDPSRQIRASVLCRSESIFQWQTELLNFPPPPYTHDRLPALASRLGDSLASISPMAAIGEHGELTQNWRCGTLLEAMYLMLYLDLTGGSLLRECASHDCSTYYRLGPQSNSKYCSEKHANRASTRLGRGQRP